MNKEYIKGIKIGLGIITTLVIFLGLVWAVGFHSADEIRGGTFKGNFDFSGASISGLNASAPSSAVMAFYLTSCPSGWKPCDGTNSTPDLRGMFIRGLNTFDNGLTNRSDGFEDADVRALGDFQNENVGAHTHGYNGLYRSSSTGSNLLHLVYSGSGSWNTQINPTGENIPKNVALIYCMKN